MSRSHQSCHFQMCHLGMPGITNTVLNIVLQYCWDKIRNGESFLRDQMYNLPYFCIGIFKQFSNQFYQPSCANNPIKRFIFSSAWSLILSVNATSRVFKWSCVTSPFQQWMAFPNFVQTNFTKLLVVQTNPINSSYSVALDYRFYLWMQHPDFLSDHTRIRLFSNGIFKYCLNQFH